jgi:hypothetical protein
MATYYPKYYYHDAVGMAASRVMPLFHERLIDFSVQNVTSSDTMYCLAIPAYAVVLLCNYQTITTVTGGSLTLAANTASITYVSSASAVAAGSYGTPAAISASTAQKFFTANDDIVITVSSTTFSAGQIKVFALMMYPQPYTYKDVDGTVHTTTFTDRNNWVTTAPTIA